MLVKKLCRARLLGLARLYASLTITFGSSSFVADGYVRRRVRLVDQLALKIFVVSHTFQNPDVQFLRLGQHVSLCALQNEDDFRTSSPLLNASVIS